jgi:hypothetical protein
MHRAACFLTSLRHGERELLEMPDPVGRRLIFRILAVDFQKARDFTHTDLLVPALPHTTAVPDADTISIEPLPADMFS